MIVKRVTQALSRQDWMAVSIEFSLVVAGVLLAFQIDEWATEREARSEREAATSRLLDEADEDFSYFKYEVEQHQQLVEYIRQTAPKFDREDALHYVYEPPGRTDPPADPVIFIDRMRAG